jgi:hypothetical protein
MEQRSPARNPAAQLVVADAQPAHRQVCTGKEAGVPGHLLGVVDDAAHHETLRAHCPEARPDLAEIARPHPVVARVVGGRRVRETELVQVDVGGADTGLAELVEEFEPDGGLPDSGRAAMVHRPAHRGSSPGRLSYFCFPSNCFRFHTQM